MVLKMNAGKEIVWRVLGGLTLKAQALKAALRAKQEAFRLRRKLQQLVLADPAPSPWRVPLPAVYPGGSGVDLDRQWRVDNYVEMRNRKSVEER